VTVLDSYRLDGDVALVTGAAGGIGGAMAESMAEAGADVALVDVDESGLEERAAQLRADTDAEVLPITADVTSEAETQAMVEETVTELGGLDVTFANAGIFEFGGTVESFDMADWTRTIETNLTGVFHTDKAAANEMSLGDGGRIINTASILGMRGTEIPGVSAYTASKGGVIQLTRHLAVKLAPSGVRVNAIAPGWIKTAMTGEAWLDGSMGDGIRDLLGQRMAMDRLGEPEDLKGVSLFLASEASAYATGEVVFVDGGMNAKL